MPTYQYKARDKFGKLVQGKMGADSEDAVANKLVKMEYLPVEITKAKNELKFSKFFSSFGKVNFSDLNMFTRQLYTLQKAGLPLLSSFNSLYEQTNNRVLKNVLGQIIRDIKSGSSLSDALDRHPKVFSPLYTNMVRAGEASGRLVETLNRLMILGEHDEKISMQIKAAVRYPTIVVTGIISGFLVLITFVIPRFKKLYLKFDTELPLPTRILISLNNIVTNYWWLLIIIVIAAVYIYKKFINVKHNLYWLDSIKLKIPVFGNLLFNYSISRFCRITGLMMRSGVHILQILTLVKESVENEVIGKTVENIKQSVSEGKGMLEPMKQSQLFPPIVTQMVAVGEDTGKLDELLLHVSDYYDLQIDYTIKNLVSLIEPMLIFVLGFVVLLLALGIFLPMWDLMKLFKR